MAKKVIHGTSGGDHLLNVDQDKADALIPENPRWESEAAYRHHDSPLAEDPELSPNQTLPGPLETRNEPRMENETIRFAEPTDHMQT